nr:hypothetical protein [Tanacetum cinerariifolium]
MQVRAKRTNVPRFKKFIARHLSSYEFHSRKSYTLAPPNFPPCGYRSRKYSKPKSHNPDDEHQSSKDIGHYGSQCTNNTVVEDVLRLPELDKFEGVDFRRYQKKMHFLLSSISVVCVLTTPILEDDENATVEQLKRRAKWNNDDCVCRGLILNGMPDPLLDIYQNIKSSKELWDSLEAKYMVEDASNFKHTLKHQKKELTLVELGSHLRIEKSLRVQDNDKPNGNNVAGPSVVNMMKHNNSFRLCHVYFKRMQDMPKDGLIPAFDMDTKKFPRPSLRIPNGTDDIGGSVVLEEVVQQPELRKSKKNTTPKNFGPTFQLYLIEGTRDEDVAFWKEAIDDEMDSIMGNNTWGFRQKSRTNYFDTYAPVARISAIRLLITMALIHNLIIHQMDVKTAFLNGELKKEVYMNQPQSFIVSGNETKLCKLIKTLYELNQAPNKFDETGKGSIICLYVDDMLIFGTDLVQVDLTKEFLSSRFSMKDMRRLMLSLAVSQLEYSRVIRCLMYVMTCTRPDIAFAVGKVSMYTINLGTQHWQAIQRVPEYLKKTMDYSLIYTSYPLFLGGYTDASGFVMLKIICLPVAGYSNGLKGSILRTP